MTKKLKIHKFNKPIKITQATLQYGLQEWLETIMLIADDELARVNDWSVGYYHCKHCDTYQGYSHKISGTVSARAHNEQLEFMLAHAHGDGRIMMFESKMKE